MVQPSKLKTIRHMADNIENKTMQLQTKVSPEVYARLEAIGKQYGFSIYEALRMLVEVLIRFGDDKHNLSNDLTRIIRLFENLPGWSKSICLADGLGNMEIVEAFYIIRDHENANGYRIVWVERPMLDGDAYGWSATYNVQRMLERFIEVTSPSLYKHLRQLAVEMGTESMLDLVHRLADLYKENPDEAELRIQFEQNDYENGNRTHQETIYKRHNSHTMDFIEQQPTLFDETKDNE